MKKIIVNEINDGMLSFKYESDNWKDIVEFLKKNKLNSYEIRKRIGENDKYKVVFLVRNRVIESDLNLLFDVDIIYD